MSLIPFCPYQFVQSPLHWFPSHFQYMLIIKVLSLQLWVNLILLHRPSLSTTSNNYNQGKLYGTCTPAATASYLTLHARLKFCFSDSDNSFGPIGLAA